MEIRKVLTDMPRQILHQGLKVEDARLEYQRAKEIVKMQEAKFWLEHKAMIEKTSNAQLDKMVESDDTLHTARMKLIELDSEYRKCEKKYDGMIELLNSAKKLASIEEQQIKMGG